MEVGDMETENRLRSRQGVPKKIDAGALFVLQSKGSWLHCGFHLTTAIVAPPLLSLPYAVASLGWAAGMICLSVGAAVSFYAYTLLSIVLDHHAAQGRRQLRFRDMAHDILGPGWGSYYVGPIQFTVCYGAVIICILFGGQSLKAIYLIVCSLNGNEPTMKLYEFIAIFATFMILVGQMPSFHSLRYINLVSVILCFSFSVCAAAGSIYVGSSSSAPPKDYSILGSSSNRIFAALNALGIIATTYGNGIIPEIQATVAPPVAGKMFKGLCICYAVLVTAFFSVAVSGYWAFGNASQGIILGNLLGDGKSPILPLWFLLMTYTFTTVQLCAVTTVYLQPTNDALEILLSDTKKGQYSARNVVPRLVFRAMAVATAALFAAMLPFFGDILGLIGALGFFPLDFVLPFVFYNITFKPSKRSYVYWINATIGVAFSGVAAIAVVASARQIVVHANEYKLFANI